MEGEHFRHPASQQNNLWSDNHAWPDITAIVTEIVIKIRPENNIKLSSLKQYQCNCNVQDIYYSCSVLLWTLLTITFTEQCINSSLRSTEQEEIKQQHLYEILFPMQWHYQHWQKSRFFWKK